MFRLHSPEIVEIIQGSVISSSDKVSKLKKKEIVVVSIIGSTTFHEEKGYKRAFRLVLDSFGSPALFQRQDPAFRAKVRKKSKEASEAGEEEDGSSNANKFKTECDSKSEESCQQDIQDVQKDANEIGAIDGFYTEDEQILFLHLQGAFDPGSFLQEWKVASQKLESKEVGFSEIWADIKAKYCRSLLLIFSLSHVILVSSPGNYFDTSYIHLFRIIDTVRLEVLPFVTKLLNKVDGIPKAWRDHGRMCSPRILFLFQTNSGRPSRTFEELPIQDPIKEMQYKLEDEIYHIFRKCRIVTNISANSLFAIPSTQEYVFMYDEGVQEPEMCDDPSSRLAHITSSFCEKMSTALSDPTMSDYKNISKLSFASTFPTVYGTNASKPICDQLRTYRDTLEDFRDFITSHSRLAHKSGFDDDSKHVAEHKHFFVLPTFSMWRKAFNSLFSYFVQETHSDFRGRDALSLMYQFTNADTEYLESQCAKMFPKVYALYLKNLPEIFPEKLHKAKVAHAIDSFVKVSRGPGVRPWITKFIEKCDRYWKRGHQQCEARSLHEHTCCHPLHRFKVEDHLEVIPLPVMDDTLPEMEHSTGHRFLSYCNCGHRQGSRDEPFTIREANFSYYERLAQDCCDNLERIDFPSFTPPLGFSKSSIHPQEMLLLYQRKLLGLIQHTNFEVASQDLEDELRQENTLEFDEEPEEEDGSNSEVEKNPPKDSKDATPVPQEPTLAKPIQPNAWVKAPVLTEQEFLPRTELENEYIYKRIRERKEAEEASKNRSALDSEKSEFHAKILKLASQLQHDVQKGEQERKDWLNWNNQKFPTPVLSNSKYPREDFFENFQLPMKAMALSLRFKPNWEQTCRRLPEHIITWVNDYTSRRRLFIEDTSSPWDIGEPTSTVIQDLNNSSITDSFSLLEEQVAAIVDTTYEESPPESIIQEAEPTPACTAASISTANNRHFDLVHARQISSSKIPDIDNLVVVTETVSKNLSPVNDETITSNVAYHPIESDFTRSAEDTIIGGMDRKENIGEVKLTEKIHHLGHNLDQDIQDILNTYHDANLETVEKAVEIFSDRSQDEKVDSAGNLPLESSPPVQEDAMQYLPGMLHSRSLPGLLPLFSSWSLVCVGSSSLYTHTAGITHQPGFLNGSSTLLPWDKMVKAEAGVSKPIPRLIRGRKPTGRAKRITDEFTVKVFLGVEYECKRGHRFLLEGPDKILQTLGQHTTPSLKEAANVVVGSDMPLYYRCPCKDSRDGTAMIAQLMRVHIITPKAPVHVVLDPKVQPGPSPSPVFYPGNREPVKLTPSSYWILRLPYCYVGDDQVYVPSKDVARYNGRLLKGLLDAESMTPEETKKWEMQNTNLT